MSTRKVRYKKLNIKTPLPVLREHQIDANEYEALTTESQIATGVEQAEENEFHLQVALRGVGVSADNEIPVPPPQKSIEADYEELYPRPCEEPRNYIKFSHTVEETQTGSPYNMTSEDDEYLKNYNSKRSASAQMSEDEFERIMEAFEQACTKVPPNVTSDGTFFPLNQLEKRLDLSPKPLEAHIKSVYEHWRSRRLAIGNKSLCPSLKFEVQPEQDDMDPYVCFRRREVRQTRKTRARDVQVADKLMKLRRELEDARQLIAFAHRREVLKRDLLQTDKLVYEQRAKLKEIKIKLNIKADDDDLVNSKPQKRQKTESQQPPRTAPHTQVRLTVRADGSRSRDPADLTYMRLLSDKIKERTLELHNNVELKVQEHRRWNSNYIDLTADPLPPVKEQRLRPFRPAKVVSHLMTPPTSAEESMDVDEAPETSLVSPIFTFKAGSSDDKEPQGMPSYRRRVGRLGRLFIDRRPKRPADDSSAPLLSQNDRWKYDNDDDEDDATVYQVDTNSIRQLKFRSTIPPPANLLRRPHVETLLRQAFPDGHRERQAGQEVIQAVQGQGQVKPQVPGVQAQGQGAQAFQIQPGIGRKASVVQSSQNGSIAQLAP
ncbi:EPL1-like protein [Xylaria sp. CBS 124048]|nr:EPL1-like protein [Xylaria sp. CBS 124048]